ncbi:MAG: hypothetical protein OXC96_09245 [Cyanobacteria bacterium MAG CAR1_bin_15]|nr:hypothetical protein [Cyanobacteria bacterium MAG CAR1_bin_15]
MILLGAELYVNLLNKGPALSLGHTMGATPSGNHGRPAQPVVLQGFDGSSSNGHPRSPLTGVPCMVHSWKRVRALPGLLRM